MSDRLVKVVIVVVTLVWGANFIAPLWNEDYKPIPELNAAFMTIVGGLILAGRRGGSPPEDPPQPETGELAPGPRPSTNRTNDDSRRSNPADTENPAGNP